MDRLSFLDELQAMAWTGLHYTEDPYDEERYERILEMVAEAYGETLDLPPATARDRLAGELGEITPKVAAISGVVDDEGRLLCLKRSDNGRWCLPGGKLDIGESPAEAAVRETVEETGVEVTAETLVDTYAVEPPAEYPHHSIACLYHCEAVGGEPTTTREADEVRYLAPEEVPEWAAPYHETFARDVLAVHSSA